MPKIYINNEWVDVHVPNAPIDNAVKASQELVALSEQASLLRTSIPPVIASMVKTSISSVTFRKNYTGSSGYASEGGCTDGTYVYFYIKPSEDSESGTLVKLRRSDWATIRTKTIGLYHGNDLTYNPDTGRLYCATMYRPSDTTSRIAVIDPSTLGLIENKTVPYYISAIAYEPIRKVFVGGSGGGTTKYILRLDENGNFISVKSIRISSSPCASNGWTSQGMACDSAFIYHSWSSSGAWRIEIYDWQGTYRGYMTGDQSKEIEWVDKTSKHGFMIGQYTNGGNRDCNIYTFSQK